MKPQTPISKLRSLRTPGQTRKFSPSLYYLLLTGRGEPKWYDEALGLMRD